MKKIIVGGITGLANRGVDALARVLTQKISSSGREIVIHTHTPDFDARVFSNEEISVYQENLVRYFRTRFRSRLFMLFWRFVPTLRVQIKNIISADVYIFSGGDLLSSEYEHSVRGYLAGVEIAQKYGLKTIIVGQSLGPYVSKNIENYVAKIFESATYVTTREEISQHYVVEQLGVIDCQLRPDPAFLLPTVDSNWNPPSQHCKTVAIGCSDSISVFGADENQSHRKKLVRLVNTLLRMGCIVVLVPHVQEKYKLSDDRFLAREIEKELGFQEKLVIVNSFFDSREFKHVLSKCDLVIAERMHVGIGAASSLVPTIFVQYSVKAKGLAQMLYSQNLVDLMLVEVKNIDKLDSDYFSRVFELESVIVDELTKSVTAAQTKCGLMFEEIEQRICD